MAVSLEAARGTYACRISAELVLRDRWLEPLRQSLGSEEVARWWADGTALSLQKAVELAEVVLQEQTAQPRSKSSPLTARQQEVAVLVGKGLTNRQIAERLVVSERAAAAHVEHILDRLAIGSRAQIVVWASERGPLTGASD